jgi:hypothetical protein
MSHYFTQLLMYFGLTSIIYVNSFESLVIPLSGKLIFSKFSDTMDT